MTLPAANVPANLFVNTGVCHSLEQRGMGFSQIENDYKKLIERRFYDLNEVTIFSYSCCFSGVSLYKIVFGLVCIIKI